MKITKGVIMEKDIIIKYSKALQEVQKEINALKVENEQLKQKIAEKEKEIKLPNYKKYFVVQNCITCKFLDYEYEDYYTTFGDLAGATIFDDELYSYVSDDLLKDTKKVPISIIGSW